MRILRDEGFPEEIIKSLSAADAVQIAKDLYPSRSKPKNGSKPSQVARDQGKQPDVEEPVTYVAARRKKK